MLSATSTWNLTAFSATGAVGTALTGLAMGTLYPGAAPAVATGLLVASLGCTGVAFSLVAMRLRRLELENEGLIEEVSQEFDRVKDRLEIYGEALEEPRSLQPEVVDHASPTTRRLAVK